MTIPAIIREIENLGPSPYVQGRREVSPEDAAVWQAAELALRSVGRQSGTASGAGDPEVPEFGGGSTSAAVNQANGLAALVDANPGDAELLRRWQAALLEVPAANADEVDLPAGVVDWETARGDARQTTIDEWKNLESAPTGGLPVAPELEMAAAIDEEQAELANGLDNFRQNLSPSEQQAYDAWLETLRNDPRIVFDSSGAGFTAPADLELAQELAYRGIAANTFGNPALLDHATNDTDQLTVEFEASSGGASANSGEDRIRTSAAFVEDVFLGNDGDNLFVHEFAHLAQNGQNVPADPSHGLGSPSPSVPTDAERRADSDDAAIHEAFLDASNNGGAFHDLLVDKFGTVTRTNSSGEIVFDEFNSGVESHGSPNYNRWLNQDNRERYATVTNLFYQFPDELQGASPELYELMVSRTGLDPLG